MTPLLAVALALALASTSASAGAPSVAGKTYDACGPWKGKMRNYPNYNIDNYNEFVPRNLRVPKSQAIPRSQWDFLDDGRAVGHPVKRAFVGVLDIIDQQGESNFQVISGKWTQSNKNIKMKIDTSNVRPVFIDSFFVNAAEDWFVVLAGHDLWDKQGPFRFTPGALPNNGRGVLPLGISPQEDYYVIYVSDQVFQVSLTPGGTVVDVGSTGTGRHGFSQLIKPLSRSWEILTELYLFAKRELVSTIEFVSTKDPKLKAKLQDGGKKLKLKLSMKPNYDIDTDDRNGVGRNFDGKLDYRARTSDCP